MQTYHNQTSSKDNSVCFSVQQKTFQMIQTFLKKFPHLLTRQEQFEQHLNKFSQRLKQYDDIFEEFKQQQRSAIVTLEKKVSCIKTSVQDNNRPPHRWSKINLPIFQPTKSTETTKSTSYLTSKDYTELKFNSIQPYQQQNTLQLQRKQTIESNNGMQSKGYDQLKETIQGVKLEMGSMKDKLGFLSAYMSQIESQQMNKQKINALKKEVMDSVESKVEEQIREKMIETQRVVIQHINNLVLRFSKQIMDNIDAKNQKLQQEITKLTLKYTETSKKQLKNDIQLLAESSIKSFSSKQEARQSLQFIDKKIKTLQQRMKELLQISQKDKQKSQYFSQLLQVNSPDSRSLELSRMTTKSQHQWTKSKNLNSSMISDNELRGCKRKQKENQQTKNHQPVKQLSTGSLTTSQVSKEFMKDFGLSKKKIVKSNFQSSKKSSVYQKGKFYDEKVDERPITALKNNEFSSV